MNYTKRPWKVEVLDDGTTIEAESQTICTNVSNCDAHLIAAAPDMYEALKGLEDLYVAKKNSDNEFIAIRSSTLADWLKVKQALTKAKRLTNN